MGGDFLGGRSKPARRRPACKTVFCVGVLPFSAGLLLIFVLFKSAPLGVHHRSLQETQHSPEPSTCPPSSTCNCSQNLTGSDDLRHLEGALTKTSLDKVLGAANSSDPQEQTVRINEDVLPSTFLFVGVLSGRGYRHRRLAVREAWASPSQLRGEAVVRFILSEDEQTSQVAKEVETYKDIVFLHEKTNYKSILYKTYFVMEYAVAHFDVRFVLKTDDDAFINVQPLIQQLKLLCETPNCQNERMYMGKMAKESEVLLQPGHKWNNIVFHNHTGLKQYPNYMMGGGYLVSGDVAQTLMNVNRKMRLKFTPIEDATMGFWLAAMDLRHIDHRRFYTWAAPCCFKAPVRRQGQRIVTRFQLQDDMEHDLCSEDPWLVLHKIDSPTKMRYIGSRVQACNFSDFDPLKAAPSIQPYMKLKATRNATKAGDKVKSTAS